MGIHLFISITIMIWLAVANASAEQKGQFEYISNTKEIFGDELSTLYQEAIGVNEEITLEIQVPENYGPENPPGLMLYISPQKNIKIPCGWLDRMNEKT